MRRRPWGWGGGGGAGCRGAGGLGLGVLAAPAAPALVRAIGMAVMQGPPPAPEAAGSFARVRRFSALLVAQVQEDRLRFREVLAGVPPERDARSRAVRTAVLAVGLGRQRGLAPASLEQLALAGLCLDVGQTLLPPDAPRELRERHPHLSVDLLAAHGGLGPVARAGVAGHHERIDGSGHPLGLRGEDVPLGARLLGLCDRYAGLTQPPVVGPARPGYAALAALRRLEGAGFDGRLFAELEALLARRDASWSPTP
ncbi:MAG: HD domain-containing phosphohydrolase [bacterium]